MGERGSLNVLLVPVILLAVLFVAAASLAVWAFSGRQDYKNNSDAKVKTAVAANTSAVQTSDAALYAEKAKEPTKTYTGPDAYGSVKITYPKTWAAYVDTTNTNTPLDAYFHTDYVPSVASKLTYNLRVQVVASSYASQTSQYTSAISSGKVTAAPYTLPNVASVTGVQLAGSVFLDNPAGSGTMVILPLRDKTLKIWTESPSYLPDFTAYVLKNLSFSP